MELWRQGLHSPPAQSYHSWLPCNQALLPVSCLWPRGKSPGRLYFPVPCPSTVLHAVSSCFHFQSLLINWILLVSLKAYLKLPLGVGEVERRQPYSNPTFSSDYRIFFSAFQRLKERISILAGSACSLLIQSSGHYQVGSYPIYPAKQLVCPGLCEVIHLPWPLRRSLHCWPPPALETVFSWLRWHKILLVSSIFPDSSFTISFAALSILPRSINIKIPKIQS